MGYPNEYKLAAKDEPTSLLGIKFDTHFTLANILIIS